MTFIHWKGTRIIFILQKNLILSCYRKSLNNAFQEKNHHGPSSCVINWGFHYVMEFKVLCLSHRAWFSLHNFNGQNFRISWHVYPNLKNFVYKLFFCKYKKWYRHWRAKIMVSFFVLGILSKVSALHSTEHFIIGISLSRNGEKCKICVFCLPLIYT